MLKPNVQSSIWLRFVKKAALYLIVIILGLQRLQQLVEATSAVSVEVLAADDFSPEGAAPEAAGLDLADMLPAAGLVADIMECAYVDVALIVERQRR